MTVGPGDAEFNDVNALIRGHMAAGQGTFAGTFSATNINAVSNINVKDGAVSAYYIAYTGGATTVSITVPAQTEDFLPRIFFGGETVSRPYVIPSFDRATFYSEDDCAEVEYTVKRNGVQIINEMPMVNMGYIGSNAPVRYWSELQPVIYPGNETLSFFDPAANSLVSNTYEIITTPYSGQYSSNNGWRTIAGYMHIDYFGVEFRKR